MKKAARKHRRPERLDGRQHGRVPIRKDYTAMMKSLYSGVAGLKTHNTRMDVIGNNISNVNTVGYKTSSVTFQDIFYQHKSYASSGDVTRGGTNANQIGYGASLSQVSQVMTQSGFTYSDEVYDCALSGDGFFQVMDEAGNIYYTRNGAFHVDNVGNLCDAGGNIVLGVSGDPTGVEAQSQRINLYVPPIDNEYSSVTKTVNGYTFTATSGSFGENGDLSITIVDGDVPFATQNGTTITVTMNLSNGDNQILDEAGFNEAFQAALSAGGIDLEEYTPTFTWQTIPASDDIAAKAATNSLETTLTGSIKDDDGNVSDVEGEIAIEITANTAGEYANKYEIDVVASKTATKVSALWDNGVLTITVPADTENYSWSLQDVQDAIDSVAGTDETKMLTVNAFDIDENALTLMSDNNNVVRMGLANGQDNFFKSMCETMGTIKLTGGHTAAEQTVEDLESVFIDEDGVIYGVHEVHGTIAMGRIDIVTFENPEGLDQVGTSYWKESLSSGEPQVKIPSSMGAGSVVSGALEMSNVDLSQEISDMIITQRGFQANSRVITVTDTMLEELINLKR